MNDKVVESRLVGDVWPAASPGEASDQDPSLYGYVSLNPRGDFVARSVQTFTLTYTVGRYGIDDTGSIRVVFRFFGDWGDLQTEDPTAHNYVTAHCSTDSRLSVVYAKTGHQRPWFRSLTVRLHGGYLREGDTITIVFGDTSGGSPGMKMQSFCESGFEFKVLADVCATGHYVPLAETPYVSIVPGPPHVWKAIVPTLRKPGESFQFGLKAEDKWGNPTPLASGSFRLDSDLPIEGLPQQIEFPTGESALVIEGLSVNQPGSGYVRVLDEDNVLVAEGGPLVIKQGRSGYWGDLHGQSGESIGLTTARQYFEFARNKSFLDVCSHQANDFQVNNAFWSYLNELTREFHQDGRFVVFPGYEWSGNTAVGGDRNVFFRHEGRPIRRSSHALLSDRSDLDTDATTAGELFDALQQEDCVVYAHVGGRYADTAQAHDGRLETAMEIHSAWGTFEWLLTDGFALGHRCGVVCNSDGHKGRPGASYPGVSVFGAYGGLTCFLTDSLSRDSIFECLRRRHHYGTTGCRMHMQVNAIFNSPAILYERDPKEVDNPVTLETNTVMMGDIVASREESVRLSLKLETHAPILEVEIRNGTATIEKIRPHEVDAKDSRIRVTWSGAEYRGRGRQTNWVGTAQFEGCTVDRLEKINAWNPERQLELTDSSTVTFDAITTGNFGGFDVWLQGGESGSLVLDTNQGELKVGLDQIDAEGVAMDAGGLQRRLSARRLPAKMSVRELEQEVEVSLDGSRDNPLWICVTTEDGFQAWSSPIFVIAP
jgi:hypothetical protein